MFALIDYDALIGERDLLYQPNAGYELQSGRECVPAGRMAFFQHLVGGRSWPTLRWETTVKQRTLTFSLTSGWVPRAVRLVLHDTAHIGSASIGHCPPGGCSIQLGAEGELSGALGLAFGGPGILRMSAIEEVERILVGNVGLALATRALNISSSILSRKKSCI